LLKLRISPWGARVAAKSTTDATIRARVPAVRNVFAHSRFRPTAWPFALLWTVFVGLAVPVQAEPPATLGPTVSLASSPALTPEESSLLALPTTRDHIGRVVVAATVNGKGPFRFIVDTGATHSTITPDLARALGLKPDNVTTIVVNGITGTAQVSAVTLDKLQTGDLTEDDLVVPVVGSTVMAGADGIFGAAGLTEKSLSVDFLRNRVRISGGYESELHGQAFKIHATRMSHGLMILPMRVGRVQAFGIIDTGSERTLGNLALRNALDERRRPGTVAKVTSVYGATTQVESGEIYRAPSISIDTLRIEDVEVVYGDFHIFKVWELEDKPAMIIGMDVLGTVASLGIDFKNQNVYLTNSTTHIQTFTPHASSGSANQVH
jgi:clan AA aspartic protease (TIGR02281 family)